MAKYLDGYIKGEVVGSGTYGECFKVTKNGVVFLCKSIWQSDFDMGERASMESEIRLLKELRHENIVRYYDSFADENGRICIIMEYCENGDLDQYIRKVTRLGQSIDEAFIWKIFYQVLQALIHCHSRNLFGQVIVHRDVKPANIFLDRDMNAKLGDFGVSRKLAHRVHSTVTEAGTPLYMSPEQVDGEKYNEMCDVWALGCTIYEMCALKSPFTGNNTYELLSNIKKGTYDMLSNKYSADLRQFITNMLEPKPLMRMSVEKLAACPMMINNLKKFNLYKKHFRQ